LEISIVPLSMASPAAVPGNRRELMPNVVWSKPDACCKAGALQ